MSGVGLVAGVFEMIEARDHQLDDLGVVAGLVRFTLVLSESLELDNSSFSFLLLED